EAVLEEQTIGLAHVLIDTEVELVGPLGERRIEDEISRCRRRGRERQKLDELHRGGIQTREWDPAACERSADPGVSRSGLRRERIEDRRAEGAEIAGGEHLALEERRDRRHHGPRLPNANALIVGEEKRPAADDRTARRRAELVAPESRSRRAGAIVEES